MAWEWKGESGPYYYVSVREGDKVRKLYLGRGEQAEEAVRQVDERRQQRQAARADWLQEQDWLAVAEGQLLQFRALAEALARAVLHAAGFHRHKGQYRRRRPCQGRPRQSRK